MKPSTKPRMTSASKRLLPLLCAASALLPPAYAFDEAPALPERAPVTRGVRQRALPEHYAAIAAPAWAADAPRAAAGTAELIAASATGDAIAAKAAIDAGAPPNGADEAGRRPLPVAVAHGHVEVVRLLLARGADPDAKSTQGRRPLALAAADGQRAIVAQLLRAGADVDATSDNRATALHEAVRFDHPEIVGALLGAAPQPERFDRDGLHPLALAAAQGRLACLQRLLDAGLDIDQPDRNRLTALYWARRNRQALAESLLVARGATREAWPLLID